MSRRLDAPRAWKTSGPVSRARVLDTEAQHQITEFMCEKEPCPDRLAAIATSPDVEERILQDQLRRCAELHIESGSNMPTAWGEFRQAHLREVSLFEVAIRD